MKLNIKKLGFATGLACTLIYLGCILVMSLTGQEGTIKFFNSLLHGLDTTSIIKMDMTFWEASIGIIQTFILGWLTGVFIAGFYNLQIKKLRL